jgi:anti-sigma factor RsiW
MANCPNEEDMACYIDRLLPEDEVGQIERHLLRCSRCREIVEIVKSIISQENGLK